LDFVVSLKKRRKTAKTTAKGISIESAYGIFKGINTHFERDEEGDLAFLSEPRYPRF